PSTTSSDIKVEYNNFARGGRNPIISVSNNHSILSQYKKFAKKNSKKFSVCVNLIDSIMNYLKSSFVFDPNPKLMRDYERIGNSKLVRDGSNLSAVLYGLKVGNEEENETLNRLLAWIRQIPEEPYQDIEFVTTSLNDVIFGFKEGNNGPFVDARKLSDGTLRALAVLTAIETVSPHSRVVIEEFDNGLHPSRVHILMQAIADSCKRRKLNIFITTHNPATLNALQPEQFEGVVFCARDFENQAFKFVKLNELPRYDELLERGRLGDLVTRRIIEQYLSPKFDEEHKAKSIEWLKSL
ncbi:MAG: ATP-binding protein, partial [Desulfobulbaceae bacterium]|nr:ATP-binding protein [Desulfobulbaceae bacterium]